MRIFAVRDDYVYKESAPCEIAFCEKVPSENGVSEGTGSKVCTSKSSVGNMVCREDARMHKDLAYLFYYEKEKLFFTELPEDADPWETPLLLSSFAERGIKTVNSYWSLRWVQQRIVPPDRQNIGMVLKENGLKEYDEFGLLMLAMGRCAQDDCYLVEIRHDDLPEDVAKRFQKRVENVMPLDNLHILVFFMDGMIKKCDLNDYFTAHSEFRILTQRRDYFEEARPQTGGYGVMWDVNLIIPDTELDCMGVELPLKASDFERFAADNIINAAEACEMLGCSRQNINELVKRGKLHPLKVWERNTLFLKSEVRKRLWQ